MAYKSIAQQRMEFAHTAVFILLAFLIVNMISDKVYRSKVREQIRYMEYNQDVLLQRISDLEVDKYEIRCWIEEVEVMFHNNVMIERPVN